MNLIEKSWYQKRWFTNPLTWALLPLSALFWFLSRFRRLLFKLSIKKTITSNVPVIVVGNISVGGNGKTPMVIWLCEYYKKLNKKVVVISRGYGGNSEYYPCEVDQHSSPYQCGDEPVLIAKRTHYPVIVGPNRVDNIKLAIDKHSPDVIISDDGMQHYKMGRHLELCIVDSKRQFGNGLLMPAGPLRETKNRLNTIDLVIENGGSAPFHYVLEQGGLYRVKDDIPAVFDDRDISGIAVSAIGNPARFETSLMQANINVIDKHHFRDHHKFTKDDFVHDTKINIFMTEKDAVKCKAFAQDNWYYLKVDAKPNDKTQNKLVKLLKTLT